MPRYQNSTSSRIRQGDILRDVEYVEDVFTGANQLLGVSLILFPYVVILSQDCDLASDAKMREKELENGVVASTDAGMESILVSPAYEKGLFIAGEHLEELQLPKMQQWGGKKSDTKWKLLTENRDQRYYYLAGDKDFGINDMVIDFKHIYTISRLKLYKSYQKHYVCTLAELYREHLSQKFAFFISRIGLPDEK